MSRARYLGSHFFPTLPQWIGTLNVRAASVAERNGFVLKSWDDEGLGEATGFACELPSGCVVLVEEHRHNIEHLGGTGADVSADLTEVARDGPAAIFREALECLSLSPDEVSQVPHTEAQSIAREMLARVPRP
jgi:hypothetical protein